MTRRSAFAHLGLIAAALLGLAACCDPSRGQSIEGPGRVEPHTLARLSVAWPDGIEVSDEDRESVGWIVRPIGLADHFISDDRCVVTGPPGEYEVLAGLVLDGRVVFLGHAFVIGEPAPLPPTPGPGPGPTPTPTPGPEPAPDDLGPVERVMIVYESAELTGREPWTSLAVRERINAIVPEDRYPDGQSVEAVRYVDDDVSFDRELPAWAEARRDAGAILQTAGIPRVFVFHEGGEVRHAEIPATGEALIEFIEGGR